MTEIRRTVTDGAISATATFSGRRSFQLFMEGLRELQAYESAPSAVHLSGAAAKLTRCVQSYPSDTLPRFYLAIVRTLEGYGGLDEAIRLFGALKDEGPAFLRLPAAYNLAAAYVEKYDDDLNRKAEELLTLVKDQLVRSGSKKIREAALIAQVSGLLAYLAVERLEPERADRRPPKPAAAVEAARAAVADAAESVKVVGIPESVKRDVLADHANAEGMLLEYEARLAAEPERRAKADLVEAGYQKALGYKRDWIPVLSNLARVYQDLLQRPTDAEHLWNKVLAIRPTDSYSNYMLGKLFESSDLQRAFGHYWLASKDIPAAATKLRELEPKVPWYQRPNGYQTPSDPPSTPGAGSTH